MVKHYQAKEADQAIKSPDYETGIDPEGESWRPSVGNMRDMYWINSREILRVEVSTDEKNADINIISVIKINRVAMDSQNHSKMNVEEKLVSLCSDGAQGDDT